MTPPPVLSLEQLNAASVAQFSALLAGTYEHSPWIAERAAARRPFVSLAALKRALVEVVRESGLEAQLGLIRAHPELAGKAMVSQTLTAESTHEQGRAGLTDCTPAEFAHIQPLLDTLIAKPLAADSSNTLARFETALETFRKIPQLYPASPLVPRALGRMADCHLQMAGPDPRRYTNALELYEKAMTAPAADLAARSPDWRIWHPFNDPAVMAIPELRDALLTASDHFPVTIDLEIN